MSARPVSPAAPAKAIHVWKRRQVYQARIIRSEPAPVIVKSGRDLKVGRRISFALLSDLDRRQIDKQWRSAVIWRIDNGCLHLTRT